MTIQEVIALPPGRALDRAVHVAVFGGAPGDHPPGYSTTRRAYEILETLPLAVGALARTENDFINDNTRPYWASEMLNGKQHRFKITAATPEIALCKAALLYSIENRKSQ